MALDNRYHRFSNPVRRGQIGTAILLLKDSGTIVHREVHHPGGRDLSVEATVLGHEFWVAVLYCPSRPLERWDEVGVVIPPPTLERRIGRGVGGGG